MKLHCVLCIICTFYVFLKMLLHTFELVKEFVDDPSDD